MRLAVLLLTACSALTACSVFNQPAAPIHEVSRRHPPAKSVRVVHPLPPSGFVVVQPGDNLFRIAFDHGLDYHQLAEWNGISDPGHILVGSKLRLTPPEKAPEPVRTDIVVPSPAHETQVPVSPQPAMTDEAPTNWIWPAKGRVVTEFNESAGAKGLDIAGVRGSPVVAAAAGRVIYVGAGLRGYGKLIIIKHSNIVLTAYGHNDKVLVKEGQYVKLGQIIAEMGDTDANLVKLHFEIREYGKPVDPRSYLPDGNT